MPVFKILYGKEELLCLLYVIKLCECGGFVGFMDWLDGRIGYGRILKEVIVALQKRFGIYELRKKVQRKIRE